MAYLPNIENSTIREYDAWHAGELESEAIDRECEAMAEEMLYADDEALIEWIAENAKVFLPALRAAKKGDDAFAAKVVRGIATDWTYYVVDHYRDEAAERVRG